jgi:serine/threonine protein phosphatase PrpC
MTKLKRIYNSKITCNDNTYNGITEINDYNFNQIEITSTNGSREYQEDSIYHLMNDNIQYLSQNTRDKIFTESLKYFDKSLSKKKFKEPSGTTLLSVMSIGNEITIANLSDSYIYLVTKKNNEYKCILLNTPFNLSNSSELNRITNLGAKFDNNESPKYIQIQNNNKIFKINPTRTIGDYLIKEKLRNGCISTNPEIIHINLNDEQYGGYDEYHLIAATDGLTINCAEIAEIFSQNDKLITTMLIKEELSKICSHDNVITIHIPLNPKCKKNGVIFTLCDGHLGSAHSNYMSKNYTNRISQLVNTLSNKNNNITDNFITKTIDYEYKNQINKTDEYLLDNRSKSLPISRNLTPNINKQFSLPKFNWKSVVTATKKNTNNTLILFE